MVASEGCDADKNTFCEALQDNQIVAVDDLVERFLSDPLRDVNRLAARNLLRFFGGLVGKAARDHLHQAPENIKPDNFNLFPVIMYSINYN